MAYKQLPESLKHQNQDLPYSPVIQIDDHYYFSGVIPNLTDHKEPTDPDIATQTYQVLNKMRELLKGCGLIFNDIFGVTIMLANSMDNFPKVNQIYLESMKDVHIRPKRKAFAVAGLPFGVLIEIEFDAIKQK